MFKCLSCKESIGPKVKPITVVIGKRDVDYVNTVLVLDEYEREQKKTINSRGSEITIEGKFCAKCTATEAVVPEHTTDANKAFARLLKKASNKHEEPMAEPLRPKLVALAVHNALERTTHRSRRAKIECENTIPTIKGFVQSNPKLNF